MDNTISTPNPPSGPLSSLQSNSREFENVRDGMPPPSLLSPPPEVKPQLVPNGGSPAALGATITAEGVNFAVYSESASALYVSLYDEQEREIERFELDGHAGPIHSAL